MNILFLLDIAGLDIIIRILSNHAHNNEFIYANVTFYSSFVDATYFFCSREKEIRPLNFLTCLRRTRLGRWLIRGMSINFANCVTVELRKIKRRKHCERNIPINNERDILGRAPVANAIIYNDRRQCCEVVTVSSARRRLRRLYKCDMLIPILVYSNSVFFLIAKARSAENYLRIFARRNEVTWHADAYIYHLFNDKFIGWCLRSSAFRIVKV